MGSKAFVFLGLLLVVFLMISSEVAARELAEASSAVKLDSEKEVEVDGYHGGYHKGGGYYKGGGYKGRGKGCRYRCKKYCCSYEEYVAMKATEAHN